MNKENNNGTKGCLFLITLFLSLSGMFSIAQGSYFYAFLYCTPLICWTLYAFLNHKYSKGDDMYMAMTSFGLVTIFFTVGGIMQIIFEEFFKAFLLFIPLVCCILYMVYYRITIVPKENRWNALRRMYGLPYCFDKENGEQWGNTFQQLPVRFVHQQSFA